MIFYISPYYYHFKEYCRENRISPMDCNKICHVNTFMKLLGRRISNEDRIIYDNFSDFPVEELNKIKWELKIRQL